MQKPLDILRSRANGLLIAAMAGTYISLGTLLIRRSLMTEAVSAVDPVATISAIASLTSGFLYTLAIVAGTIMCWLAWSTCRRGFTIAAIICFSICLVTAPDSWFGSGSLLLFAALSFGGQKIKQEQPNDRSRPLIVDLIVYILASAAVTILNYTL